MGYTYGHKWTYESTKEEIIKICASLGISYFPTKSEVINFCGNNALSNRISRSGGTKYWAKELNLPIKDCESNFGNKYELIAAEDIEKNTGLTSVQTKPRYPYDLLTDNNIKVDAKVSKQIFTNCHTWQNSFNIEKKQPTCDIFILYCLDRYSNYIKTVIIPSCILSGQTQIGVGKESKWDKYRDAWEVFYEYKKFYDDLITR